jgi:hypothetical protein
MTKIAEQLRLRSGSHAEIAQKIADTLSERYGEVPFCEGKFWRFDATHWVEITYNDMYKEVLSWENMTYGDPDLPKPKYLHLSNYRIVDILKIVCVKLDDAKFFDERPRGINCTSGFISYDPEAKNVYLRQTFAGLAPTLPTGCELETRVQIPRRPTREQPPLSIAYWVIP